MKADNTNSKHLELYSVMAEHDNAGFPVSYCLLLTATSIEQGKRKKALAGWATCIKEVYDINPIFVHVDKDMAEISMAKEVWPAKINLCWWHLRRAVWTRLGQAKLTTTPYNVQWAHIEFPFIDITFFPPGQADAEEHEGGVPDDIENICPTKTNISILNTITGTSNTLSITIPARKAPSTSTLEPTLHHHKADKENQVTEDLRITLKVPPSVTPASSQGRIIPHASKNSNDESEEGLQNGIQ